MAGPYYVRSTDGSDASDGLTWANAKATLVGALAVATANERIWISQAHAETQASAMTLTSAGSASQPIEILCGNDAAEPPTALATTATISTTGASAITFGGGHSYVYGITFRAGDAASAANVSFGAAGSSSWILEACEFSLRATSANNRVAVGSSSAGDAKVTWLNCNVRLAAAGQGLYSVVPLEWRGGSLLGTVPTLGFIKSLTSGTTAIRGYGLDLSLLGSNPIVTVATGASGVLVKLENCKLGTSWVATTGSAPGPGQFEVWIDNCSDGDQHYIMQRRSYVGHILQDTLNVRSGGASNGTTPIAWLMNNGSGLGNFVRPLYSPEIAVWNSTTGASLTVTVEILFEGASNLQDDEVWLEVEYPGTSGVPQSAFASDRMTDLLSTPADQTTSSATWDTTGISAPKPQKLAVIITPQEIGLIRARVAFALANLVYVDPLLTIA